MEITITKGRVIRTYEFYLKNSELVVRVNNVERVFSEWATEAGYGFLKRVWPFFRRAFCVKLDTIAHDHNLDLRNDMIRVYECFFKRYFRLDDALPDIAETVEGLIVNFEIDSRPSCSECIWECAGCKPPSDMDIFCGRFATSNDPLFRVRPA